MDQEELGGKKLQKEQEQDTRMWKKEKVKGIFTGDTGQNIGRNREEE